MAIVCEDTIVRTLKNGDVKKGYSIDTKLKANLDFEIERVNKSWDCVGLITGPEGSAKTTFGSSLAYYMSTQLGTKFDLNSVVFTTEQFSKWLDNAPPGSVCLWDEFVLAGMSTEALSKVQNILVKQMTMMRKRRLVVLLVIPYIFLLRKYFAIARTRFCIHVYSPNNLDRGYWRYYSEPTKRYLYLKGIKMWEYKVVKPDGFGRFPNTSNFFYNADEYDKKKDAAMGTLTDESKDGRSRVLWLSRLINLAYDLIKNQGWTYKDLAERIGMDSKTLRNTFYEFTDKHPDMFKEKDIRGAIKPETLVKGGFDVAGPLTYPLNVQKPPILPPNQL